MTPSWQTSRTRYKIEPWQMDCPPSCIPARVATNKLIKRFRKWQLLSKTPRESEKIVVAAAEMIDEFSDISPGPCCDTWVIARVICDHHNWQLPIAVSEFYEKNTTKCLEHLSKSER